MSGPLFFAVLMVLVFAFGIGMFWQESKRMSNSTAIYGVEDSIDFIWEGLGDDKHALTRGDVRRILEWEMYYLQQPDLWEDDGPPVVGGPEAATYAQDRSHEEGHNYEPQQIYAVLDLQAAYLQAIGAIAAPVDPDES
jgi:hypothetical protein